MSSDFAQKVAETARLGQLLTGDGLMLAANASFSYFKRDFLFRGGVWRDSPVAPAVISDLLPVLVTGHSAIHVTRSQALLFLTLRPKVSKWWATNAMWTDSERIESLPIGLTNDCDDSPQHRIFGDQRLISTALEAQEFQEPKIYANFEPSTFAKERENLWKIALSSSLVVSERPDPTSEGRLHYLQNLRRFGFVVCPRGRGQDTHRLFETLAMGSIPILLRKDAPAWLTKEERFPKILIEEWTALPSLLLDEHTSLRESFDPGLLSTSFWLRRIMSEV